jgi:hypothetical protein
MRGTVVLTLKATAMPDPGEFWRLLVPHRSRIVMSDLLDDDVSAQFIFGDARGKPPQITQADMNRVTPSAKHTAAISVEVSDPALTPRVAAGP